MTTKTLYELTDTGIVKLLLPIVKEYHEQLMYDLDNQDEMSSMVREILYVKANRMRGLIEMVEAFNKLTPKQ